MTLQSKTLESFLTDWGLHGFKGITALKDGGDATILNVSIAAGAVATLRDGTHFNTAELLAASGLVIPGNSTNHAAVTLWLDADAGGAPAFSVRTGTTNPSPSAIAIDTFVVAGNVITTHVAAAPGLSTSVGAWLANTGQVGFNGITALKDGSVASILNITVAAGAWAVLGNGKVYYHDDLVAATPLIIPGNTTNAAAVTLWLDQDAAGKPVFSVLAGTTNPSGSAIAIDQFVVAGNVITTHTAAATGIAKPASFPAWS